jgi:hypothetical protein
MVLVTLSVEPDLCGPVSVGTVCLVKLLAEWLELPLAQSVSAVDRCVFEGDSLRVRFSSPDLARRLLRQLSELPLANRINATLDIAAGAGQNEQRTAGSLAHAELLPSSCPASSLA